MSRCFDLLAVEDWTLSTKIELTATAKAEIKNKAQRLAEAERAIVLCLYSYIDRMNDYCEADTAEKILDEFTEAVRPLIDQHCTEMNENRYG